MERVTLGNTGLCVCKNGFGALPIQRISKEDAVRLLIRAYEGGVDYFDTARAYTDSEEKIGQALKTIPRDRIVLATKTLGKTGEEFREHLDTSLSLLGTDYIDVYQFHNPDACPRPGDGSGLYEAALKAREEGKIRFIGITSHKLSVARDAVRSGLYATLQFPLNYLSDDQDQALARECEDAGMGFIAMKALSGGLITNSAAAFAFLRQFRNVLPIWGIQRESELDEFLSYQETPPALDESLEALIRRDKEELVGEFCRGCGYCLPCPAGIEINDCARMSLLLRRSPSEAHLSEKGQARMRKIENCLHCGSCSAKCPYGLDTPALLQRNYEDYMRALSGEIQV